MKTFVNEQTVMKFYIEQLDADNVVFLQGKDAKKAKIKGLVEQLMNEKTMNGKIGVACKLWKALFDASLSSISSDKQGYDKIYKFFDAYVEFEELIFASDSFYRDHTLHCIWVYFLGEYLRKNELYQALFLDMQRTQNMVKGMFEIIKDTEALPIEKEVFFEDMIDMFDLFNHNLDAVYCVAAITHDLGYPLKKIEKINKSIKKVLPFFAVNNFDDFSFEFNNIQQEFISDFIDFISRTLSISVISETHLDEHHPATNVFLKVFEMDQQKVKKVNYEAIAKLTKEEKEAFAKMVSGVGQLYLHNGDKNKFLNDFENYQHGIMSAFVLTKNLGVFQNIEYDKNESFNMFYPKQLAQTISLNTILKSISCHTSDGYKIKEIDETSLLTFIDELEEFSRISRASQNREYVKEFCETYFDLDEDGWFNIIFEFHNDNLDNLDPEISFKGRCKRFLTLFDIAKMSSNLKLRVSCVGKLASDQNTYVLEVANHHVDVLVNGVSQDIPNYLKATNLYTKEEYAEL